MRRAARLDPSSRRDYASPSMAGLRVSRANRSPIEVRHLRAPTPIHFPEAEDVPEGYAHLVVRTFLFQLLQFALGPEHTVGSDQFIYWNATDPRRCLSPDVFVRLEAKQRVFGSWKTWEEGGAPDLAVEVISPNEGDGIEWDEKVARYHELGVRELVRFDPEGTPGRQIRVWDRVEGDLVERVQEERPICATLGLRWIVAPVADAPSGLRLADETGALVLTALEAEQKALEAEQKAREAEQKAREAEQKAREAEQKAREAEQKAREAAEARVRELEALLRAKG